MSASLLPVLAVAAGSALGATSRWGMSTWLMAVLPGSIPWSSFAVNVVGSILIGVSAGAASMAAARVEFVLRRAFWIPGFCGGFTSFSIFSLDSIQLLMSDQEVLAAAYILASLLLWLAGAALGWWLGCGLGRMAHS